MIDAWLMHMETVRTRFDPEGSPLIIHWSGAEPIYSETAYNWSCRRHPERSWTRAALFDLLERVFRAAPEPSVVCLVSGSRIWCERYIVTN